MTTKFARRKSWDRRYVLHDSGTKTAHIERATDILKNFVVTPLGTSAERDEELRAIWREAQLQGR